MKKLFVLMALVLGSFVSASVPAIAEDYKSYNPDIQFTAGAGGGLGLVNSKAGLAVVGNVGARILKDGFVPDIVNPVYLEAQFGPMFTEGESIFLYSTHLRWDFIKNEQWTLFALGGLGGNFYDNDKFGKDFAIHPRVGVGAFLALDLFDIRAEVSHEMTLVGLSFPF